MADKTITQLTATTSAATADEIPIWVAGSAVTRKITKANFLQGAFTGGGTVATGGFTLTVPATGKAALSAYGSWTPALKFGGGSTGLTTSALFGDYTILSNGNTANPLGFCIARFVIALSALGSSTGNATITGLPFTSGTQIGGATIYYGTGLASITTAPFGSIAAAGTTIALWQWGSTGMSVLTHANFTNSSVLQGYAYYYTATL